MNALELVVMERNRLIRLSIVISIVAFSLAVWSRDPRLNFTTPFSGSEAGNITVGHAILIGQPLLCMMFFVLVAQIVRYTALVDKLPGVVTDHLRWKVMRFGTGRRWVSATQRVCDFFRWFGMVAIPAVACGFLLDAQTDFYSDENGKPGPRYSYGNMFDRKLYDKFYDIKPAYLSVRKKICTKEKAARARERCEDDQKILKRMPTLYQPYNFVGGVILQLLVILGLMCTVRIYFFHSDANQ